MKTFVRIETQRNGYYPDQCGSTLTVGQLIEHLQLFDMDNEVFFSNDNGYTYGNILLSQIEEDYYGEDDGDEDED